MKKVLTTYGVRALAFTLMVTLAQAQAQTPAPVTSFRDCSKGCPEMVVVKQGKFTMGAPAGEEARENLPNELRGLSVPQHLIKIQHKLAIAKFDVTRDEYAQFVAETNRPDPDSCTTINASGTGFIASNGNWHSPGFPQTGRDPVVCVSWALPQGPGPHDVIVLLVGQSEKTKIVEDSADLLKELCSYRRFLCLDSRLDGHQ